MNPWNLYDDGGRCRLCTLPRGPHAEGCGGALLEGLKLTATYRVRDSDEDPDDEDGAYHATFQGSDGFELGVAIGKAFASGTLAPEKIVSGPVYGIEAGPPGHLDRMGTAKVPRAIAAGRAAAEEFKARLQVLRYELEDARARHSAAVRASYEARTENARERDTITRTLALEGLSAGVREELEGRLRALYANPQPPIPAPFEEESWRERFRALEQEAEEAMRALAARLRANQ